MTMPNDPMTLMASAAAEMHEMFSSYLKAGFSRKEALYLVGKVISAQMIAANSPPDAEDPS